MFDPSVTNYYITTTLISTDDVVGTAIITEAEALAMLGNLHITRIKDVLDSDGYPVIIVDSSGVFRRFFDMVH